MCLKLFLLRLQYFLQPICDLKHEGQPDRAWPFQQLTVIVLGQSRLIPLLGSVPRFPLQSNLDQYPILADKV